MKRYDVINKFRNVFDRRSEISRILQAPTNVLRIPTHTPLHLTFTHARIHVHVCTRNVLR